MGRGGVSKRGLDDSLYFFGCIVVRGEDVGEKEGKGENTYINFGVLC